MNKLTILAVIPLLLLGAGCNNPATDQTQIIQEQNRKIEDLGEKLSALTVTSTKEMPTAVASEPQKLTEEAETSIVPPDPALLAAFRESALHSSMADIAELSCFPQSRFNCTANGCVSYAPATYYFVDYGTERGTYFRCDAKGCDPYPVTVSPSGIYTQFSPSNGQSMLFKVTTDDVLGTKGEFVDVATIGTGTVVSFGKCQ